MPPLSISRWIQGEYTQQVNQLLRCVAATLESRQSIIEALPYFLKAVHMWVRSYTGPPKPHQHQWLGSRLQHETEGSLRTLSSLSSYLRFTILDFTF